MTAGQSPVSQAASAAAPGSPQNAEGPVFAAPWEAHAFAMTLMLHERGLFTWPEWTQTLAREIERAQEAGDADTGESYYRHWLTALEQLAAERGMTDRATLGRYREAWARAAERTPHGSPIELASDDLT